MAPRVTLVTGCSSGIGLVTAVQLAQDPTKSYLVYATMRNLAKKDDLEKAAGSALNDTLFVHELDITKEEQIVSTVKHLMSKHGRIDVLVNNAAFGYIGLFEDMTMSHIRNMSETNIVGTFRLTQEVIPIMKRQRSGRIVNISSLAGIDGFPFSAVYSASKYAMEGFTDSLSPELRCFNVWISTICPGPVQTKFLENIDESKAVHETPKSADPSSPSGKIMTAFMEQLMVQMKSGVQQGSEIVDIIVKCLNSDKPSLRYATSEYGNVTMSKYVDGVGASGAEKWHQMILPLSKE